jgi:hypothetical protein
MLHLSAAHPIRFTIMERATDIHGTGNQSGSKHDLNETETQPRCPTADLQLGRRPQASDFIELQVCFRPAKIESDGSGNESINLRINAEADW